VKIATGLTIAFLTGTAATSYAAPKMTADDAKITVSADHADWTGDAPIAKGDTVEIPLKAGAAAQRVDLDDKTVKRIDVVGGESPRMIMRLHHSKSTTLRTASAMQVWMLNGELHVSFPREPGHAVEAVKESVKAEDIKAEDVKVQAVEPAPEALTVETPVPVAAVAPVKEAPIAFAEEPSRGGGRMGSLIVLIVLGAVAGIAAMLRKKRAGQSAEEPFRIIASKTLGPKAKIFMVEVEDKKLLFTVDEKGTRLVQTFGKKDAASSDDEDLATMSFDAPHNEARKEEPALSPAVAGLLKLRERHAIDTSDAVNDEASADTDWASMLLRATNRRGQS
jgi:flagellar biogenesis protein FliO